VIALATAPAASTSAWDQPGTIAFLVVFGMCVVMFFVFRSMAKHLRKINDAARAEAAAEAVTDSVATMTDANIQASPAGNGTSPASS
jgi:hypothetical protein